MLKCQLVLQMFWNSAEYLGAVEAENEQAADCKDRAEAELEHRECLVDISDMEVN